MKIVEPASGSLDSQAPVTIIYYQIWLWNSFGITKKKNSGREIQMGANNAKAQIFSNFLGCVLQKYQDLRVLTPWFSWLIIDLMSTTIPLDSQILCLSCWVLQTASPFQPECLVTGPERGPSHLVASTADCRAGPLLMDTWHFFGPFAWVTFIFVTCWKCPLGVSS